MSPDYRRSLARFSVFAAVSGLVLVASGLVRLLEYLAHPLLMRVHDFRVFVVMNSVMRIF